MIHFQCSFDTNITKTCCPAGYVDGNKRFVCLWNMRLNTWAFVLQWIETSHHTDNVKFSTTPLCVGCICVCEVADSVGKTSVSSVDSAVKYPVINVNYLCYPFAGQPQIALKGFPLIYLHSTQQWHWLYAIRAVLGSCSVSLLSVGTK